MSNRIPILLYHSLRDASPSRFRKWTVRPALFAEHVAYLASQGYTPFTVTQLATAMANPEIRLPDNVVALTFDDGFADFYTCVLPVLKRHAFTATLYITTQYVGRTSEWLSGEGMADCPMLNWDQIDEIRSSGVECGSHGHSHAQLDLAPSAAVWSEVTRSKQELEQRLRQPVRTFAYPHGHYNMAARRMVQQADYHSACAVKHAMSAPTDDLFALSRLIVACDTGIDQFARLLAGRGRPVAPKRERVRTKAWRRVRALVQWQQQLFAPRVRP